MRSSIFPVPRPWLSAINLRSIPRVTSAAADGARQPGERRAPPAGDAEQFQLPDTLLHRIICKLSFLLAAEHKTGMAAEDKEKLF